MENILAIPDIQDSILCHLSNEDLFNLGSINKSGHESVSYYSQRKLYQYINYFMKRLSKMSKQEDVPHYSQYMALYNYYVQIKQLYHCLHNKKEFQRSKFIFIITHLYLPVTICSEKLYIVKQLMDMLYQENGCSGISSFSSNDWYRSETSGKWVQSNRRIWYELSKKLICLRDNTHSCKLLEFDETKILPINYNGKPSTGDWYRSETTGKWVKKTNDME